MTSRIYIGLESHPRVATTADIMGAFASGHEVTLKDNRDQKWYAGLISAIKLESGYHFGETPKHLLVSLIGRDDIYVWCH